jgi:hypothetical protein
MTILPTIPYTTTNRIFKTYLPASTMANLQKGLGKIEPDDEPITYLSIVELGEYDILEIGDVLWCMQAEPKYDDIWRRCALKFAKDVSHLIKIPLYLKALDVAESYINGLATKEELEIYEKEIEKSYRSAARAAAKLNPDSTYAINSLYAIYAAEAVEYAVLAATDTPNTAAYVGSVSCAAYAANADFAAYDDGFINVKDRQLEILKEMVS